MSSRILIACDRSGVVRRAFRELGYSAWSCDTEAADDGSPYHHTGDVRDILNLGWDGMVAHPPCTHLAVSGARWFKEKQADGRQAAALAFVRTLLSAPIPRIALENPVSIISTQVRKPDCIVQPWMFGDEASKTTCWWLKGLPPLTPTAIVGKGTFHTTAGGKRIPSWYNLPGNADRSRLRSQTFPGMARAMAEQWGPVI